jgi:hypothetical protein
VVFQYLLEYKFLDVLFSKLSPFKLKFHFRNWLAGWFPLHFCNAFKIRISQCLLMQTTQLFSLEYDYVEVTQIAAAQHIKLMFHYDKPTSSAVGRSLGSNARSLCKSLSAEGSALGNFCEKGIGCFFLILLRYLLAFSFRICSQKGKKTF